LLTHGKAVHSYLGFGVLALLGTALLQIPSVDYSTQAQTDSPTTAGELHSIRTAFDGVYSEACAEFAPSIQSFTQAAGTFVDSNATTARLQFAGMANSLSFSIHGDWLPAGSPAATQTASLQSQTFAIPASGSLAPRKSSLHRPGAHPPAHLSPSAN
jgi:hypothetical protein